MMEQPNEFEEVMEGNGNETGDRETRDCASDRLVDAVIDFIRTQQRENLRKPGPRIDEEQLARVVVRRLWRNPIPTALLGLSAAWLLLAGDKTGKREEADEVKWGRTGRVADEAAVGTEEEHEGEGLTSRLESELARQLKGGYDYSRERLHDAAREYPWATGAAVIGAGLLAALLLPPRPDSKSRKTSTTTEPVSAPEPVSPTAPDAET